MLGFLQTDKLRKRASYIGIIESSCLRSKLIVVLEKNGEKQTKKKG